ncbi:MAG: P-loop containing nucleoside triphosphate hydrolase protein [Monoraphidium minutum]|nr:MAG: P-loop containing nucleoside triphosphate hydrolase protein [Monoraphidium minutum]
MKDENDFDPGFSFDVGEAAPQPAWEFGGALKQALEGTRGTSIDAKIQQRLKARDEKAAGRKRKIVELKARRRQASLSDDDDDDDEEGGGGGGGDLSEGDSDEDAPLPGEQEDDEDGGSDILEDDDDASSEEEAAPPFKQQQKPSQQQQKGKAAEARAAQQKQEQLKKQQQKQEQQQKGQPKNKGQQQQQEQEEGSGDEEEPPGAEARRRQQPGAGPSGRGAAAAAANGAAAAGGRGKAGFYAATPEGTRYSAGSFSDLQLSRPLLRAAAALGYASPTPIQAACVPLALAGRDICGSAVTGSGKTAAFALPILERLLYRPKQSAAVYVLILTPTRELAAQIHSMVSKLAQFTDITAALIVGGLSLNAQAAALRKGPEIVVATPGRIIDHLRNTQSFGLEDLAVLVLDEADRLLEMGFKEEVREIVRLAPKKRQTMLFSATFSEQVRDLMALSLKQPVRLAADAAAAAPKGLVQEVVRLKGAQVAQKEAVLLALCARAFAGGRAIIFARTKQRAHRLKILFGLCKLPPAAELHGDMTQAARLGSLERFRSGEASYLLATDVAARGLDIQGVQAVINFDAPRTLETYLHRIGRTARAGAAGAAVTLAEDADRKLLRDVVKRGRAALRQRLVPAGAVGAWQGKVEKAEPDVQEVLREEYAEAELRRAEMEAAKMENMVEHEAEIYSRPARTWFQSEKEKRESKDRAKAVSEGRPADGGADGKAGAAAGAKAKQDAKNKRRAALKEARAAEAGAGARGRGSALAEETEEYAGRAKSIKSRTRELQMQGMPASRAARIAAAAVTGTKTKSKPKKKAKTDLFSGDGLNKPTAGGAAAGGAGGAAGGAAGARGAKGGAKKSSSLSKTELNRVKRGGKGKGAFKSKRRHKRR